jgi:hypothetical protein
VNRIRVKGRKTIKLRLATPSLRRIGVALPRQIMADDHPLALELSSLKAALEKYQAGVHAHTPIILVSQRCVACRPQFFLAAPTSTLGSQRHPRTFETA